MKNVQNIKHPRGRHILQECLGSSELPTDTLVVSYHGHPGCLHFKKYCLVGGRVLVGGPGHAPPPCLPPQSGTDNVNCRTDNHTLL